MNKLNVHKCNPTGGGHFGGHLGYWTKPMFKLGQAFDKSNPYI